MEEVKDKGVEVKDEQTGINEQGADLENKDNYTKEEMETMLQAETDRRVASAMKKVKKENSKALKEAQKLADMNEEDKREYAMKLREDKVADAEKQLAVQENKITALKIMAEKSIPATLVDFVVAEDAEETLDNIKLFDSEIKKAVAEEVKQRLGSPTPNVGSPISGSLTKEQFKKMSIAQQNELFKTNKELYIQLSK